MATKEDKELLLKDLCERLPYGVKIYNHLGQISTFYGIKENFIFVPRCVRYGISYDDVDIESIKPYLRPMSSMTEEEYTHRCAFLDDIEGGVEEAIPNYTDWLNSNYFDYRGLIEKGLALEAPEGMYNL